MITDEMKQVGRDKASLLKCSKGRLCGEHTTQTLELEKLIVIIITSIEGVFSRQPNHGRVSFNMSIGCVHIARIDLGDSFKEGREVVEEFIVHCHSSRMPELPH